MNNKDILFQQIIILIMIVSKIQNYLQLIKIINQII